MTRKHKHRALPGICAPGMLCRGQVAKVGIVRTCEAHAPELGHCFRLFMFVSDKQVNAPQRGPLPRASQVDCTRESARCEPSGVEEFKFSGTFRNCRNDNVQALDRLAWHARST